MLVAVGQGCFRLAGSGDQTQADEIRARERARIVQRQVRHHRHPVVLDLPVAQRAFAVRMIRYQRLEQPGPVRCDTRRTLVMHEREKLVAILRVGARKDRAVCCQPLNLRHRMQRVALCVPPGRISAPEAVQQFLRLREREVVRLQLHVEQHDIDVVEEVEVDVNDLERERGCIGVRVHARGRDVRAAEHAHRRLGAGLADTAARAPFPVEELLHVGQEGDELVIVAFVETRNFAGVFVERLAPRRGVAHCFEQLPRSLGRDAPGMNQAQRP
jgi:hypothetical protein